MNVRITGFLIVLLAAALLLAACVPAASVAPTSQTQLPGLWQTYESVFKDARYVDLTHAFAPVQPVWPGFGNAVFKPAVAGRDIEGYVKTGEEFTYEQHGFIATAYDLTTDQYGTQLDPPAHWDPLGATISDLPATEAIRPLVVADGQAVISPSWSIHCGVGTGAYAFCWGMGGENQTFEDMDPAPLEQLR